MANPGRAYARKGRPLGLAAKPPVACGSSSTQTKGNEGCAEGAIWKWPSAHTKTKTKETLRARVSILSKLLKQPRGET
jgi:hypothetical protein